MASSPHWAIEAEPPYPVGKTGREIYGMQSEKVSFFNHRFCKISSHTCVDAAIHLSIRTRTERYPTGASTASDHKIVHIVRQQTASYNVTAARQRQG